MRSLVLSLIIALITLSGCSIYRMDIRQGNIVEQKDVDKIRMGMNKDQILFILGKPVVHDTFDNDTWYYIYSNKAGKTREETKKQLIITFKDNKVTELKGDFRVPVGFDEAIN